MNILILLLFKLTLLDVTICILVKTLDKGWKTSGNQEGPKAWRTAIFIAFNAADNIALKNTDGKPD